MMKNYVLQKKQIILQKSGGAMAPLAPPVSTVLFSCEHCHIFKNVNFEKHLQTATFEI